MPTAIIAGLPLSAYQRIRAALKQRPYFSNAWTVTWMRSIARAPGLRPSQIDDVVKAADSVEMPHVLIFRGHSKEEDRAIFSKLASFFRVRWLDQKSLRLVPRSMDEFFAELVGILDEELEWDGTVRPTDTSCCLLLPECAFSAEREIRHVWAAATEAPLERIRLAARAQERFKYLHWLPYGGHGHHARAFNWTDTESKIFDHRGARHGESPFPRCWKYSYRIPESFHYDVKSADSRKFRVRAFDGSHHEASGPKHINVDAHGYII